MTRVKTRGTQFTMYVSAELLDKMEEMRDAGKVRIMRVDPDGKVYTQILEIPESPNQITRLALEVVTGMVSDAQAYAEAAEEG